MLRIWRTLLSKSWTATVTILVQDNLEKPVANATVAGAWSKGATGSATCTTNSSGICQVSKTGIKLATTSVTFSVTGVSHATLTYKSSSNHDPDGDSTGTVIVIKK